MSLSEISSVKWGSKLYDSTQGGGSGDAFVENVNPPIDLPTCMEINVFTLMSLYSVVTPHF
jgi:hypothetical protein